MRAICQTANAKLKNGVDEGKRAAEPEANLDRLGQHRDVIPKSPL